MLMSLQFMADLCYIFIYIIKWFLKSPACFQSHSTKPILIEVCWKTSLLHYCSDSIFEKETSKSKMTVMQFNMELLFQLRELFIKYSILLDWSNINI